MSGGHGVKSLIKRSVKAAIAIAGPILPYSRQSGGRVLTYHNVGQRDHEMNVTPGNFEKQMAWLAEHVSVQPLSVIAEGAPGVAISFDDGYRDNLIHAAPVLKHHGFSATMFVVADFLGERLEWDVSSEDSRLMTPDELRQWESAGLEIGAHTMTHRRLSHLRDDEQEYEIQKSKQVLEDVLGHSVSSFAYPYGSALDYNEVSVTCVERAGYTHAFSNRYGAIHSGDGPWAFRRIWVDRSDSLDSFINKVTGRLDGLSMLDSTPGILGRRALNRMLGTR